MKMVVLPCIRSTISAKEDNYRACSIFESCHDLYVVGSQLSVKRDRRTIPLMKYSVFPVESSMLKDRGIRMSPKQVSTCDGSLQEENSVGATASHCDSGRKSLVDQLYRGYGSSHYAVCDMRYARAYLKMFGWAFVVNGAKLFKRVMDIVISSIALVVLSPLFIILYILIRLQDGGPALFWQMRVGLWGKEFRFPKFRSMVMNAEAQKGQLSSENQHGEGITFKIRRDPRITNIGGVIRKLSLDELPQLWCVLKGEMSLVGPRPPVPQEVARYSLNDRRRLEVKPGLTCIWQVSGRSELPFEQQVRMDAQYIDSHSLLLDILLLAKTIPAILIGRGAY